MLLDVVLDVVHVLKSRIVRQFTYSVNKQIHAQQNFAFTPKHYKDFISKKNRVLKHVRKTRPPKPREAEPIPQNRGGGV